MTYAPEYYGGTTSSTVAESGAKSGQIIIELIIGDDYLATNARSLGWTVSIPTGTTIAESECELTFVQASGACTPFEITFTGTIAAATAGYATLSFDMTDTLTATIPTGEYTWFVTWVGDAGEKITKVYNRQLVKWKEKEAA